MLRRTEPHLGKGAIFYDLHREQPGLLDLFAASIKDGRGRTLHRRLFAIETTLAGEMTLHEPQSFSTSRPRGGTEAQRPDRPA